MAEDDAGFPDPHGLGCRNIFHLTLSQYLRTDQAAGAGPGEDTENDHDKVHALCRVQTGTDDGGKDHGEGDKGQTANDLRDTHDDQVCGTAEITGKTAQNYANECGNDDGDGADSHGHTAAIDDAVEHVTSESVGTKQETFQPPGDDGAVIHHGIILEVAGVNLFYVLVMTQ